MKSQAYKGHLAMLSANILWGLMSPVSKAVLIAGPISALSLTTFRMVGAAVIFWLASLFMKKEHVNHQDLMKLFFAALLGIVLNQGSFIFGVSLTSPINASIVTTTTPIITMIIAAFYLKEPVTGKKVIGIFVGAAGALLLILSSQSAAAGGGKSSNIWGDLLCLLAQFSFSFYFVLFKGLIGKYSPITLMKWMFTYASICTIPFTFNHISAIDFANLPSELYLGIAYVVIGGTFLPYLFIPIGQTLLRPTVACMYNYVQPIVASLIAVLWGMDTFGVMKGIAVALVFSGVYIVTQSKSRAQLEGYQAAQGKPE
ncbi:DMT family transporter [Parabacteroides gordonii]|jgi:drug/metabolite transporter (DMT)-like permease|uniref:DMT family transporter n=1 Tax=Parabacteroides gordonii TaxID=574930 RepID=UPI0024200436|nr:DMT family transporter [Parabacteroides gordonii]